MTSSRRRKPDCVDVVDRLQIDVGCRRSNVPKSLERRAQRLHQLGEVFDGDGPIRLRENAELVAGTACSTRGRHRARRFRRRGWRFGWRGRRFRGRGGWMARRVSLSGKREDARGTAVRKHQRVVIEKPEATARREFGRSHLLIVPFRAAQNRGRDVLRVPFGYDDLAVAAPRRDEATIGEKAIPRAA